MAKKKKKKAVTAIAKLEQAVAKTEDMKPPQLVGVSRSIKNTLAVADSRNAENGTGGVSLEQIWDEVCEFTDTNEMVRINLQQIQVMFQEAFSRYYSDKVGRENMLKIVEKKVSESSEFIEQFIDLKRLYAQEEADQMKVITTLSSRVEGMAKEYRQCALQKKWVVHIALVIQFKLAVESAIHRNISDPQVLSAISEDIRQAAMELFKVSPED